MTYPAVWLLGLLLLLLVTDRVQATEFPLRLNVCPAHEAGVGSCPCSCTREPTPWWTAGDGLVTACTGLRPWGSALLAGWLGLGRMAVPLGVGGLLLGLLGMSARACRRRGGTPHNPPVPCRQPQLSARLAGRGGRWARAYAACRGCGETARKHRAHGLCSRCYQRYRARFSAAPEAAP